METIKISIIVPAYNVAKWLPRCIDSIINQTYKNLEIILIDDGSTDDTSKIIDEYAKKDSRIIPIHQKNAGLVEVRERGILIAQGAYVGFVDGDDAIDLDMYERLLSNALEYNADISHCGLRMCYENGKEELRYGTNRLYIHSQIEGIREILSGEMIEPSLCNKLYRKDLLADSCLDKKVLHNEDFLRNYILFKRAKKSVYQDFCGYQYWYRESSMSNDGKVINQMKHILSARKCVLEESDSTIRAYALKSWLSTNVDTVNSLIFSKDIDAVALCEQCRGNLIKERKNIKLLIKRQQIAAWFIVISLKLHRSVYRGYKEVKKR